MDMRVGYIDTGTPAKVNDPCNIGAPISQEGPWFLLCTWRNGNGVARGGCLLLLFHSKARICHIGLCPWKFSTKMYHRTKSCGNSWGDWNFLEFHMANTCIGGQIRHCVNLSIRVLRQIKEASINRHLYHLSASPFKTRMPVNNQKWPYTIMMALRIFHNSLKLNISNFS